MKEKEKNTYCFLGIGGISMSALALFLASRGNKVFGFDKKESEITNNLVSKGIAVNDYNLIDLCNIVVVSSAISNEDELLKRLLRKNKKIINRGELLYKISSEFPLKIGVAGTHGKTTTTAMLAHILNCANLSFSAHIGGLDSEFGNMYLKGENIFLSEVCEYKKNIALFNSEMALLLNVANDHVESYGNFNNLKREFSSYLNRSKTAFIDYDFCDLAPQNAITFSINNSNADYYAKAITYKENCIEYIVNQPIGHFFKVKINSFYLHDVKNSLGAIAVARELGISEEDVQRGLDEFKGVKRRREVLGKIDSCTIFADYAHHPEQLKNTIDTLNKRQENYALFFQSHTYSRTKMLLNDFVLELKKTPNLFIFDTYGAREKYDYWGSGKRLGEMIAGSVYCGAPENVEPLLLSLCKKYSTIAILGAGDLYDYCEAVIKKHTVK